MLMNFTYKQAMTDSDKEQWVKIITKKYNATVTADIWDVVDYQHYFNIFLRKWVLKIKNND